MPLARMHLPAIMFRRRRFVAVGGTVLLALMFWVRFGPIDRSLLDERRDQSTLVLDRQGTPLYEALSDAGTRRVSLDAEHLPSVLAAATVAVEDRRFWSHPGVDPIAMARAAVANLRYGRRAEGGSTLSQQVAKLLLARRSADYRRGIFSKISEAVLALRLEHRLSKRTILAMYLNLASYGNQLTGAERASREYFDRPASMLTAAQAAFLSGLPQRPSGFNPYRNRAAAVARQQLVLRRMLQTKALSQADFDQARVEQMVLTRGASPFAAPHVVEMALARYGNDHPARIETTIDRGLQTDVQGIIVSQRDLLHRHGARNVAVVVLDNASADWLAWEGSGDYDDEPHGGTINGPVVPRQPGSALKPFTYALAFEQGFTPASVLPDVPSHFSTREAGVLYTPRNYDGRYRGPLRARIALAGSENVPAVALASELGVPGLLRFLERAGLSTFNRNPSYYGLGLTLGNAEVRLDELVGAYAALARGGRWIAPDYVRGTPRAHRDLVSARTAFWIADILSDANAREYIFGRGGSLEFPFPVAVKTGTSQAYHDNWTIGYSRHVTVGVWVGNFDRAPLRDSSGVTGAGPIFHSVMLAAERRWGRSFSDFADGEIVARPVRDGDVVRREICALSGLGANPWCPVRTGEWLESQAELLPCSWHHLDDGTLLTIWPAEYRQWASTNAPVEHIIGSPMHTHPKGAQTEAPFRIASPADGSTFLIDPTLRREFQAIPLRVVSASATAVRWQINGRTAEAVSGAATPTWSLVPGRHTFVARDPSGRTATATIDVR